MHLTMSLPASIAPGDVRTIELDIEVIEMVAGQEFRNQQWEQPRRGFEVSYPPMQRTNADFIAVQQLWEATEFGLHSFNHSDPVDGSLVRVRFDGKLSITHVAGQLYRIDTIMLVEVDEDEE